MRQLMKPLSPRKIRYYDISKYKNELAEDLIVQTPIKRDYGFYAQYVELEPDGTLVIRAGFPWDGASGPTWDTPSSKRGSCVHDALYYLERRGLGPQWRDEADAMIRDICIEDGMWAWRAKLWYKALRIFAAGAAKADKKWEAFERVLEAP